MGRNEQQQAEFGTTVNFKLATYILIVGNSWKVVSTYVYVMFD